MQQAWYIAKYASFFLKPWSGTAHTKREWLEKCLVLQKRNASNIVFQALKKKNTLNTKIWSTVYGIYASFLKSWTIKQPISSANDLKYASFFKRGILQISFFKPKKNHTLNTEIWNTVYGKYASFWKPWRKTAHKQKYEIAQCQLPEITLSNYVCIFLHFFYFTDNRYVE